MLNKSLLVCAAALAVAACDNTSGSARSGPDATETTGSASSSAQMKAALNAAAQHGLSKELFLKKDVDAASADELREAILSYASALANGVADPNQLHEVYTLPRPQVDVKAGFEQALNQDKLGAWLDSLAPSTPEYKALSDAFVSLSNRLADLKGASIPANGKVIKVGDSDPRIPAIVRNLRTQGYLSEEGEGGSTKQASSASNSRQPNVFTSEISDALKQWQAESGLKADGIVGPNTVEQLNSGPGDRARKLAVAMERLRWLPREEPATRIDVNTAASFLEYFREGKKIDQRKVIVGQPGWETPQLGSPIYALVANPNWVVPDSIVKEDIQGKSSSWLEQNNFAQKNGKWVQEPGPESALGLVKFAMKNDHAIYLHDTPHKGLFGQEERHESHGCVRVENAMQFAKAIAQQEGVSKQFDEAMGKDEESQVQLPNEIPVRLLYRTAFLGSGGKVQFAEDAYGWDNAVASALGFEKGPTRSENRKRASGDIGP